MATATLTDLSAKLAELKDRVKSNLAIAAEVEVITQYATSRQADNFFSTFDDLFEVVKSNPIMKSFFLETRAMAEEVFPKKTDEKKPAPAPAPAPEAPKP